MTNDQTVTQADERLWCLHHVGPDEVHPAPDFATAQKWADWANHRFYDHAEISRFVVALWPWPADRHAEGLAQSIADWTLPPQSSVCEEADALLNTMRGWSDSQFASAATGEYCEDLKAKIEGVLSRILDRLSNERQAECDFSNAVWSALKGDHNDLRRQALILRAYRTAHSGEGREHQLSRYVQHLPACKLKMRMGGRCDCGLSDLRRSSEARSNGAGEAVSVPAGHLLARGLRTSQKALDEINRQEQANIAGYIALRDFPVGSTSAQFPPDAVGPNKLSTDWQAIAAQLREISRISNDYDLRAAIEGHGNGLGDSGIWRDLMDQCDRLAALSAPQGGVERLTSSPIIEAITPTNDEWASCETVQDTYNLMKRRIRAALAQPEAGGEHATDDPEYSGYCEVMGDEVVTDGIGKEQSDGR